ncbi:DUF2185 domain-containing protein [Sphingopyxis sp. USTB-05]|uniref:immunity protein Imm33 domain-containing protein n=1 Tax=Sphingopyxis sp. USTB-05 TaxID=2830667 RepID=UPI00207888E9|nr:DUF2185 domain-containing protein [Sphingopyxis sp. USTB-05]USI78571.1 DUF2185 domain-containing protein [Sphingopyxis sp. USTB-05]
MAGFSDWLRGWFGKYRIDDPRPTAAGAPYTYYLPSENELLAVAPGDLVKIIFESIPPSDEWGAERMWVIVTAADGDELTGTLDNNPADMPQLEYGDIVQFRRGYIIDIDWAKDRLVPPPSGPERRWYWERCFVDDQILDGRLKVEYLYREEPDPPRDGDKFPDSGWRFRCDTRNLTDEEYNSPSFSYIAVGKVLNKDDSWLHLIDEPVGSAFLRDWSTGKFVPTEMRSSE